jgi:hypothetical protein
MSRIVLTSAVCLCLFSAAALACSVPVFRYALERWAADPYQVEVSHQGNLSPQAQALVQRLAGSKLSNLRLTQVPAETGEPKLIVRQPMAMSAGPAVWQAELTESSVGQLLDSPIRQEIATRLGQGDSAVWLLLESGDPVKDGAVAELLEKELGKLATELRLPELDAQDVKNGLVSLPDEGLRLSFPTLRVSREDVAESFLVKMLLATEPDLAEIREPMVFPVFGRGRVLYALVGQGIRADNLAEAARFLIGSCSCQIKEQNPGVDLLLTADWQTLLNLDKAAEVVAPPQDRKPVLVPIPERSVSPETPLSKVLAASGGLAMAAMVILLLIRKVRR